MGWFGDKLTTNDLLDNEAFREAVQTLARSLVHEEFRRRDRQARADAAVAWFKEQGFEFTAHRNRTVYGEDGSYRCTVTKNDIVLGEGHDEEDAAKAILRCREQVERALKAAEALRPK